MSKPGSSIWFFCEHCGQPVECSVDEIGAEVDCPNEACGELLKVPAPDWRDKPVVRAADVGLPTRDLYGAKTVFVTGLAASLLTAVVMFAFVCRCVTGLRLRRSAAVEPVSRQESAHKAEPATVVDVDRGARQPDSMLSVEPVSPAEPMVTGGVKAAVSPGGVEPVVVVAPPGGDPVPVPARVPAIEGHSESRGEPVLASALPQGARTEPVVGSNVEPVVEGILVAGDTNVNTASDVVARSAGEQELLVPAEVDSGMIDKWVAAAWGGDSTAAMRLAKVFEGGHGSPTNLAAAARWFALAHVNGDDLALLSLAALLPDVGVESVAGEVEIVRDWTLGAGGTLSGVFRGVTQGCVIVSSATTQGEESVSMSALSDADRRFAATAALLADEVASMGRIASRSDRLLVAKECLGVAVRLGSAAAAFELGDMAFEGRGCPRDMDKARTWFETAVERGSVAALVRLGLMYLQGVGVDQDAAVAVKLFRRAADRGDADAQYRLGLCHAQGDGVDVDVEAVAEWYGKAAAQGHPDALMNLGIMNANGDPPDPAAAADLFCRAGRAYVARSDTNGALRALGQVIATGETKKAADLRAVIDALAVGRRGQPAASASSGGEQRTVPVHRRAVSMDGKAL